MQRRAPGGRVDPRYRKELLAKSGIDTGDGDDKAFLDRPSSEDPFVEERGETFVQSAITGEDQDELVLDPQETDPEGGPFVVTTGNVEFGREPDASNPEDAEPAPFPTTQSES